MKAIITKYATTKGPILMDGELLPKGAFQSPGDTHPGAFSTYFHGSEWHTNKRSATDDVLDRFKKKQAFFKRQLAALQEKQDKALKAIEGMELL